MTDSTTIDSGKMQEKQRRATDKPRAAKVRSSFNPLHPSMELPPEQLIRLLGLESKKIRKHRRIQSAPVQQTTTSPGTSTTTLPPELERSEPAPANNQTPTSRPTHRQREYEQAREQKASKNRRGLWLPALVTGLICGAAASAYLFWTQPQHDTSNTAVAPAPNKVNRSTVTGAPGKAVTNTSALAKKSPPTSAAKRNPAWLDTIEAREKHLRNEAKQRIEQRLKQTAQTPQIAAVPVSTPQPGALKTDAPVVQTPPITTEPVSAVPQREAITTDAPAPPTTTEPVVAAQPEVINTGMHEAITTGEPVEETATVSHDETLTENLTSNPVTEPGDKALQAPETPDAEASNAVELNEAQVHTATTGSTDQPGDEATISVPVLDTPPREGAAELF